MGEIIVNDVKTPLCVGKSESKFIWKGAFIWLNDIEVSIGSYCASLFLAVLNLVLIRRPLFTVSAPYMEAMTYALGDIQGLNAIEICAVILGVFSILGLIFPLLKCFEWKYRWFVPVAVMGLAENVLLIYLFNKRNDLLQDTLIGNIYNLLSIKIEIASNAWFLLMANGLLLVCVARIMLDIYKNNRMYSSNVS